MKSKKDKLEMRDSESEMEKQKTEDGAGKTDETTGNGNGGQQEGREEQTEGKSQVDAIKAQLEEKTKQCAEYYNALQRAAAEFDNFKKRTAREKEALYAEAVSDVAGAFLPVIDSIDRAIQACGADSGVGPLKEGVELVCRQARDVLKNLGVEEIKSVNEAFDPNLHNAVMHIEDESLGQSVVVEEFLKGYIYKEKVIRHSMVKVAN